jgi:hypothetical protein
MKVKGTHVVLEESEISDSACPLDPKQAAGYCFKASNSIALYPVFVVHSTKTAK